MIYFRTALTSFTLLAVLQISGAESLTLTPSADTGLFQFAPDNNLGASTALQVGTNNRGTHGRGLFRFPVAESIPPGARIDSVAVTLNVITDAAGTPGLHDLYRIQLSWEEGDGSDGQGATATEGQTSWDARHQNQSQWTVPGGAPGTDFALSPSANAEIGAAGSHRFASNAALVSDVQLWLDQPHQNFGWALISRDEGSAGASRRIGTRELVGSEPQLTIEYTPFRVTHIDHQADGQVTLDWQGGTPPFLVDRSSNPSAAGWALIADSETSSAVLSSQVAPDSFYRVRMGPVANDVRYRVTWKATWSSGTHPSDFPESAHFSALYGSTHNEMFTMWEPGGLATPGIRRMAETGSNSALRQEIQGAQATDTAKDILPGSGISSPGRTSLEFNVSLSHPLVSLVCMIAPSPDWFVGVHGLALFENDQWLESKTVSLQAYDAGTDSGAIYSSSNVITNPPVPIFQITPSSETRPFGSLTFELIDP